NQRSLTFAPDYDAEDALWLDRDSAAIVGRKALPIRWEWGTISAIVGTPSANRVAYTEQSDYYSGSAVVVVMSREWSQPSTVAIPPMYPVDPGLALAASSTEFFTTSGSYVWLGGNSWKLESHIHRISAAGVLNHTWTLPTSFP